MDASEKDSAMAAQRLAARNEAQLGSLRAHAFELTEKLGNDDYPMDHYPCFCGSTEEKALSYQERMGIPHKMVVCKECALIRANPRLTDKGYAAFYNYDYRFVNPIKIRDPKYIELTDDEVYLSVARDKGEELFKALDDFRVAQNPKVVVDYGCHIGGMAKVFLDKTDAEVWGIEIDEESADKARGNGLKVVSSIDELIEKGIVADLVIMQDIIEHLLDLRTEMEKVKKILKPLYGALYIWTPGYFKYDPTDLWQIAHTYQFCRFTLEYVMQSCGYAPVYCDEAITSVWQYSPQGLEGGEVKPPVEWVEYIVDSATKKKNRRMPPFHGFCKFSRKELYENVAHALALSHPDLAELAGKRSGEIMCVAAGPSVDGELDTIKEMYARGVPLIVIAKMFDWAKKHGLDPDYVMAVDAMDDQVDTFRGKLPDHTTYLLATVAHKEIFTLLKDKRCYIWDSRDDIEMTKMRYEAGYRTCLVLNCGSSVGIGMLSMALTLGFKDLHVFGLDSMVKSREQTHSKDVGGDPANSPQTLFEITIEGEKILTSSSWIDFARQALAMLNMAHASGEMNSVKFYGESLCMKMWDGVWHSQEEVVVHEKQRRAELERSFQKTDERSLENG